jgi:hypothetical protein
MAESWNVEMVGAQADDVNWYQSALEATYTSTAIIDTDGVAVDFGAPKLCSARFTVVTITGTTQLLDVKLQSRQKTTDSWVDVTNGAFTQTNAAGEELILVNVHRLVRVVSNFTNTITAANYNVILTAPN